MGAFVIALEELHGRSDHDDDVRDGAIRSATGPDGTEYVLWPSGWLGRFTSAGWETVGTGVESFAVSNSGSLFELSHHGELYLREPGKERAEIATGIRKFFLDEDDTVLTLRDDNGLYRDGMMISGDVQDFDLRGGIISILESHGSLLRWVPGIEIYNVLALSVRKFAVAPNGPVYYLRMDNSLYRYGTLVGEDKADFAVAPDGALYVLGLDGRLDRLRPGENSPEQHSANVRKIAIAPDGTLHVLTTDGDLYRNGVLEWPDTQDFAVGRDGSLYRLDVGGNLKRLPWGSLHWETLAEGFGNFTSGLDATA